MGRKSRTFRQRFGDRVRVLRVEKEWSQEELGQRCWPIMDRSTIGRIEAGQNVRLDTIERLARALRCRMAELMPDWE